MPATTVTTPIDFGVARIQLWPLVLATGLLVFAADFLFWNVGLGLNLGVFSLLLAVGILGHRRREQIRAGSWAALALLIGASVQSAIEVSFTNGCVLAALLLVLAGGTHYTALMPVWRRWVAQLAAVGQFAGRYFWLSGTFLSQRPVGREGNTGDAVSRAVRIIAPALLLVVVFAILFARGNVQFQNLLSHLGSRVMDWLLLIDWSPVRLIFWLVAGGLILSFLRPRDTNAPAEIQSLGVWRRPDQRVAWLQCVMVLVFLNALFAVVNTVDVVEFWNPSVTAESASLKEDLHDRVHNLIAATVLAAIVLAGMFQQQPELTRSQTLRGLGHLWIVQNLILAACICRRDYFYVMNSQFLTEKRIYVMCFLALVVLGYFFLAIHVQRGGRLGWLLGRNALATFALFYVIQFCDCAGYASNWCAQKAVSESAWRFDARYWATQGPAAWPAILKVAKSPREGATKSNAVIYLAEVRELARQAKWDWRSYQWRETRNVTVILATP